MARGALAAGALFPGMEEGLGAPPWCGKQGQTRSRHRAQIRDWEIPDPLMGLESSLISAVNTGPGRWMEKTRGSGPKWR